MYFLLNMGILCIPGTSPRGTCNSASESSDMRALNIWIFQPAMLVYQRVGFSWGFQETMLSSELLCWNNISLTWRACWLHGQHQVCFVPTKYWCSEIPFPESQSKKKDHHQNHQQTSRSSLRVCPFCGAGGIPSSYLPWNTGCVMMGSLIIAYS